MHELLLLKPSLLLIHYPINFDKKGTYWHLITKVNSPAGTSA